MQIKGLLFYFIVVFFIFTEHKCSNDNNHNPPQLTFPGIGDYGIFDPSLANDPDTTRIWMSYSEVDKSTWDANKQINTRLAYSDNSGATWQDSDQVINQSEDLILPGNLEGTWVHEVSSICYDASAPPTERWKLVWHRYIAVGSSRLFEHGWISMKTAASIEELQTAAERKLFVGSAYDNINDTTIGVPEVQLDLLHPDLNACLAFSEPAVFSLNNALYICLLGAEGNSRNGRVVLLKYPYPAGPWEYKGTFIQNNIDGPALGYHGFSAPFIYEKNSRYYLIVTPQIDNKYLGSMIFEIEDIDTAVLKRSNGSLQVIETVMGRKNSHNGAATYTETATKSGLIYSEIVLKKPYKFKIYLSEVNP